MNVFEAIKKRRSVRSYLDKSIEEEKLHNSTQTMKKRKARTAESLPKNQHQKMKNIHSNFEPSMRA
jgi:hypothetical protein